ncbi:MAG: hypothetical protein U1E76_18870 [Planctomycetota bacterium]
MPNHVARHLTTVTAAVVLVLVAVGLNRLADTIPDPDVFYHIRHAWLYRTRGLTLTEFPWVQCSVIRLCAADLWYGFHLLLLPFTFGGDLLRGVEIGSIVWTASALLLVYAALRRMAMRWALGWTFLFAFIAADITHRLTMLRPQPISLGLDLLLVALLTAPPAQRGRALPMAFLLGVAQTFVHYALFWVPVLIFLTVSLAQLATRSRIALGRGLALIVGLGAGMLLRPNPLGALQLLDIQLFRWLLEKQSQPLMMAKEAMPLVWSKFIDQYLPVSLLVILAVPWFLLGSGRATEPAVRRQRVIGWTALALAMLFLALSFKVALRSTDFYVAFATLFVASAVTGATRPLGYIRRVSVSFAAAAILTWAALNNVYRYHMFVRNAYQPLAEQEVAQWLERNTPAGAIVFHVEWDKFAPLFFWNQHDRYINGMDPIFEYAYDAKLYWKHHHLLLDHVAVEADRAVLYLAADAPPEDVYQVMSADFKAAAIVVDPQVTPHLLESLRADHRFKEAFQGAHEMVFEVPR